MGARKVVVLDTNVLVSAIGWNGPERRLYNKCRSGDLQIGTSLPLLQELERVLQYPKLKLDQSAIDVVLANIHRHAVVVDPDLTFEVVVDTDDNRVLECAVSVNASWIVSGDKHLLTLEAFQGIPILRTSQALQILDESYP